MRTDSDANQKLFEASATIAPGTRKRALLLLFAFAAVVSAGCDDPQPDSPDAGLPSLEIPDNGVPTDPIPSSQFLQIGARAEVRVGANSYSFVGYTAALWADWVRQGGTPDGYVASCSVVEMSDGKIIVGASFYKYENRNLFDSFSLADDGTSTVIWGLNDFGEATEATEEWSAGGGQNSVSLTAKEFFAQQANRLLVVEIAFAGTATENFSSESAAASSVVKCLYVIRDL